MCSVCAWFGGTGWAEGDRGVGRKQRRKIISFQRINGDTMHIQARPADSQISLPAPECVLLTCRSIISPQRIDDDNILQATLSGMKEALDTLSGGAALQLPGSFSTCPIIAAAQQAASGGSDQTCEVHYALIDGGHLPKVGRYHSHGEWQDMHEAYLL